MIKLGKLRRIDPRQVWQHEAHDFTPWLREHVDLLSETVGLDLDLIQTESPVGSYAVDLYAKDLNTGRWVIIENQLERTDHGHLGQLMAYAAGKEAGVVIWISPEFRDEHRRTLDWLNEVTDETISFFGIELELLQVNDSLPAPHFKLVAQPSEWEKQISSPPLAATPRQQAYKEFFAQLLGKVKARHPGLTNASKAYPQSWFMYPVGRAGFGIGTAFAQSDIFRVELYIDTRDRDRNKAAFDALYQDRQDIEAEIDQPVVWERLDDKQASRIYCSTNGSIDDDQAHLEHLQDWATELIGAFHRVFKPLIQDL